MFIKNLGIILVLLVAGVLTASSYAKIDPKTCVGMWLFDEGSGKIAKDSSGNKSDGTLMNGPKWVDGKFNKALEFNGKDNFVEVPSTFHLASASFSITAWINITANNASSDMGVVNRGDQTTGTSIHLHCNIRAMKPYFGFYGNDLGGVTTLSTGKWYFIGWVYDLSSNIRQIYVNGVPDSQDKPPSAYKADHPLWIGKYYDLNRIFNGLIDEVAIFNVALKEGDIQTIMNQGLEKALGITAVFPSGKLTTTWVAIKAWH